MRAAPGERNSTEDEAVSRLFLQVDAALGFVHPDPAASTQVLAAIGGLGTGHTADARITLVVQFVIRQLICLDIVPDHFLGPGCQWADFGHVTLHVPGDNICIGTSR